MEGAGCYCAGCRGVSRGGEETEVEQGQREGVWGGGVVQTGDPVTYRKLSCENPNISP